MGADLGDDVTRDIPGVKRIGAPGCNRAEGGGQLGVFQKCAGGFGRAVGLEKIAGTGLTLGLDACGRSGNGHAHAFRDGKAGVG